MKKKIYILTFVILSMFFVDGLLSTTTVVRAADKPTTNRGICINMKQNGAWLKDHVTEIVKTCADEGIRL